MNEFYMKEFVYMNEFGELFDGDRRVAVDGVALLSTSHSMIETAKANAVLLAESINTERATGKTPRQLAEENTKLREEVEDLKREVDSLYHSQREGR